MWDERTSEAIREDCRHDVETEIEESEFVCDRCDYDWQDEDEFFNHKIIIDGEEFCENCVEDAFDNRILRSFLDKKLLALRNRLYAEIYPYIKNEKDCEKIKEIIREVFIKII